MVHHTPHKAEVKSVQFPPINQDTFLECCMISMNITPCLVAYTMVDKLTHIHVNELRGVSTDVLMIRACNASHTTQGRGQKCCMASMGMIHLFGCLCNGVSTSPMHTLMNWERCHNLYGWLELRIYHTPLKAEAEHMTVVIRSLMAYHLSVVQPLWIRPPCLVAYIMMYQPHPCTHW